MSNNKLFLEGHELAVLNRYYIWLLEKIDFDSHSEYSHLLEYLHNKNYIWNNPMDENRSEDGLNLRIRFEDESDYADYSSLTRPSSVLEMLIAFAERINTDVMSDNYSTAYFFWLMLDNLGCNKFKDDSFDATEVDILLNQWLNPIEKGGKSYQKREIKKWLFPLKSGKTAEEGLDEWERMQRFVMENEPFR